MAQWIKKISMSLLGEFSEYFRDLLKENPNDEEINFILQETSHLSTRDRFDFDDFLLVIARKENDKYLADKLIEAF